MQKKTVIVGNGGSGKSFLAAELGALSDGRVISLDDIFWMPGGFNVKRDQQEVEQILDEQKLGAHWIVEGVFGELAEVFTPFADCFIFLDLPWDVCRNSILQRVKPHQTPESIASLIDWCEAYGARESKCSQRFHKQLYAEFSGVKHHFETREQVNEWLGKVAVERLM